MPLRALINGDEVLAPFISDTEWLELKAKKPQIVLPCCNEAGFLRTSKLGIKHFVHKKKICDWKPESQEHLMAKTEIVKACRQAGYSASTEVSGLDWRADVLAVKEGSKGKIQIAFEVQWSYQTLEETQRRQAKYKENGIRCCWLFRCLPKGGDHHPCSELPMFQLVLERSGFFVCDTFSQHKFTLSKFIVALLTGKFKFCTYMICQRNQKINLAFFRIRCSFCRGESHAYYPSGWITSQCQCYMNKILDTPGISTILHPYAADIFPTLEKPQSRLALFEKVYFSYSAGKACSPRFKCPWCYKVILQPTLKFAIDHLPLYFSESSKQYYEYLSFLDPSIHEIDLIMPENLATSFHLHWCYSDDRQFCQP